MPRRIPSDLTLDRLRKDAKRWLKALRAGDADASSRLAHALPDLQRPPTLRDVQLALARELGLPGWAALKEEVHAATPDAAAPEPPFDTVVSRFLDNACPDHHVRGGGDHVRAEHTALRLLERYPAIARASFYTAVVCGDIETVTRMLSEDPGWATRRDGEAGERAHSGGEWDLVGRDWGPKGWDALLYLTFARLPLPAIDRHAVDIARVLLDHGADPNSWFAAGGSRYTPLVGAIGEGEEGRPAHQQRDALVSLLLERGADPYDSQVGYNLHFIGRALWFLTAAYEASVRNGRAQDWADPEWPMLGQGGYGSGARWYLDIAVDKGDLELAKWCLEHGANPNAAPGPQRRNRQLPLYEEAVRRGHVDVAELLLHYGAYRTATLADPVLQIVAAVRRGDLHAIRETIGRHPELLQRSEPLWAAAETNQLAAAKLLLDLGTSPDIESAQGERALHIAGYHDAVDVAELLVARGADVDAIGRQFQNTPLGGAMHMQSQRVIALLRTHTRNLWELGFTGNVERLRELLAEDPSRARASGGGETLLMWLPPEDEAAALEIAELLLAHGADASARDRHGMTAADRAERNAMFAVARLLRRHERR